MHIIKHRGFGLQQTSHHSHTENDSHLNIVIKENLKRSNETKLIKTSCNDEQGCRWDLMLFTLHTHKHTGTHFGFHILSTGCVMMPVIKVGNCLTEVLRYWIRGQFCRHYWRQLDVKSLSSEIGSRAEQTQKMVSASKGDASIVLSDPCEWHSVHLLPYPPWDSHWLCPLASWNQTLHVITAVSLAEVRYRSYLYKGI